MKINIKVDLGKEVLNEASKIGANQEKALVKLLRAEQDIKEAIGTVKEKLKSEMIKFNPNCTHVKGDFVTVSLTAGSYPFVCQDKTKAKDFYTERVSSVVDNKKVKTYFEKNGELPDGFKLRERSVRLTLKKKEAPNV